MDIQRSVKLKQATETLWKKEKRVFGLLSFSSTFILHLNPYDYEHFTCVSQRLSYSLKSNLRNLLRNIRQKILF